MNFKRTCEMEGRNESPQAALAGFCLNRRDEEITEGMEA